MVTARYGVSVLTLEACMLLEGVNVRREQQTPGVGSWRQVKTIAWVSHGLVDFSHGMIEAGFTPVLGIRSVNRCALVIWGKK